MRRKGVLTIVCDSAPVLATVVQQSDSLALFYLFLIEDDLRAGRIRALPDPSRHSSTRCASTTTTWRSATLRYSLSLRRARSIHERAGDALQEMRGVRDRSRRGNWKRVMGIVPK